MGMFDYVRCRYPLPHAECQDLSYQSKDTPEQGMQHYEITLDGNLLHESFEKGAERRQHLRSDEDPKWVRVEYRGELEIHTTLDPPGQAGRWVSYLLWFRDGRVIDVQPGNGHFDLLPERPTVKR